MEQNLEDNLKRIKELSEKLKPLPLIAHIDGENVSYDTVSGTCNGVGLMNNGRVAVQYAELSAGAELVCHIHEGMKEILICYSGDMEVVANEPLIHELDSPVIARTVIYTGGVFLIDPFVPHIVKSIGGCKLIAITIPASAGYPPAKNISDART